MKKVQIMTAKAFSFLTIGLIQTASGLTTTAQTIITGNFSGADDASPSDIDANRILKTFLLLGSSAGVNVLMALKKLFQANRFKKAHYAYLEATASAVVSGTSTGILVGLKQDAKTAAFVGMGVIGSEFLIIDLVVLIFARTIEKRIARGEILVIAFPAVRDCLLKMFTQYSPYGIYAIYSAGSSRSIDGNSQFGPLVASLMFRSAWDGLSLFQKRYDEAENIRLAVLQNPEQPEGIDDIEYQPLP